MESGDLFYDRIRFPRGVLLTVRDRFVVAQEIVQVVGSQAGHFIHGHGESVVDYAGRYRLGAESGERNKRICIQLVE